jgi:hypothetical protein
MYNSKHSCTKENYVVYDVEKNIIRKPTDDELYIINNNINNNYLLNNNINTNKKFFMQRFTARNWSCQSPVKNQSYEMKNEGDFIKKEIWTECLKNINNNTYKNKLNKINKN